MISLCSGGSATGAGNITASVGIDLGTTNSCVAAIRDGKPVILGDDCGDRTTPSVVARTDSGDWLVGAAAKRQAVTNPANTVFGVKRLIGQAFDAAPVVELTKAVPYAVTKGTNGDAWVRVARQAMSPPELCSHILRHIKALAGQRLPHSVDRAVVTVPAYFDDAQRQATRDAGSIAGLDVAAIVNEPTAAAIAYGHTRSLDGAVVAVFDLGGGTFDVSILEIEGDVYRVMATRGDCFLGGDDFDRVLIDELMRKCGQEYGVDLRKNTMALQRLKEAAETAKADLSALANTKVTLPFLADGPGGPVNLEHRFERSWFEQASAPLLARLDIPCRTAMSDAGLGARDVDCVILVGGMTRMPAVQQRADDLFGTAPAKDINPDEIVALGAALHAASLDGASDVVLLDVAPHSIGVKVDNGRMSVIVPRNTTLPVRESREYKTLVDDQDHVKVQVYQGDHELVAHNRLLGTVALRGLPPGPAGSAKVDVAFDLDTDGIVRVVASERETGRTESAALEHASGLSRERVDQLSGRATATAAAFESSRRRVVRPASVPKIRRAPSAPLVQPDATPPPPEPPTEPIPPGPTATLTPEFFDTPPTDPTLARAALSGRMTAASSRRVAQAAGPSGRMRSRSGYGHVAETSRRMGASVPRARPSGRARAKTPRHRESVDPIKRDHDYAAKADLFVQLGMHWTDNPARLGQSLDAIRAKYGPQSPASAASPEWAAKRVELAEAAYARLSSVGGRRAYRADIMHVDVRSAADLLFQQARLDIRRADLDQAIEKLSAAMDLDPTQARRKALDAVLAQKRG